MSGLVAVHDARRGAVPAGLLERMARAIAHRGPDGWRRWHDRAVAMAHGLLHTTPESQREQQPLTDETCALVWDGRLDNRDELLGALRAANLPAGTGTDPELVLGAYRLWGTACAQHLLGAFAFVVWDRQAQRLFAARDRVGLKPLYYTRQGTALLIASEAKALLAGLERTPDPDDDLVLAMLLSECREGDNSRTLFSGIHRLPPGHAMAVERGRLQTERYWRIDPERQIRYHRPEAYVEHFRTLFDEAVRARTRSAFPVGCFLSGGLDSSAIVATAAALGGARLDAFTIFDRNPASDERHYARLVAAAARIPLHEFADEGRDPLQDLEALLFAIECPLVSNHSDLAGLGRLINAQGCRVMLDGDGGDHLIDESGYLADLLVRTNPARFLRETRAFARWYGGRASECAQMALQDALPTPMKHLAKRLRGLPAWINRATARRAAFTARWAQARVPLRFPSAAQRLSYQDALSPYTLMKLELNEREAAQAGREIWYPFLDSRLIEFILAVPWQQRCRDGERKWLLREAMKGLLPEAIRLRRGKGDGTAAMDQALQDVCRRNAPLANRSGMLERYVEMAGAQRLVARYLAGSTRSRWDVWSLVTLDAWLNTFWKGGARDGRTIIWQEAVHAPDAALVR